MRDVKEPPPGFWQREASHNPRPLTPLGASLFLDGVNQSFPKVFTDFGLLLETLDTREIGGYVYNRAVPFGSGTGAGSGKLPPSWLLWLVLRVHPAFRQRIARCRAAVRERLDYTLARRWLNEWRPRLVADIARLRAIELSSLSDEQLAAHFEELRRWMFDAYDKHFYLTAANGWPLAQLSFFCRDELGYDDLQTLRLMSGLSGMSSEPALALARLADRIRTNERLRTAVLAATPHAVPEVLRERASDARAEFDAYLHDYGCRALSYEVVEATLGEQPELVGRLLQDQLQRPVDLAAEQEQLARERAEAKSAALAALLDEAKRARFLELVQEAELVYPIREDNEFFTMSVPLALCRFVALEAGKRLAQKDAIPRPEDVFFLRFDEVAAALRDAGQECTEVITERRQEFAEAEAFDPPASYGVEPPRPPLGVLPREAREAMEVLLYVQDNVFESERSGVRAAAGTREISGRAAARGTYEGTARVIMGEHEFDKLRPGDVLVCPITSPVWSILFAKIGALVTDSGGILSHPAIIAREYGIPAVVATGNGTQIIVDGQRVAVDGDRGVVRVVE